MPAAFDPRAVARLVALDPEEYSTTPAALYWPSLYFRGQWADRHPLNVPGPFYGAETDTCCMGPGLAPQSVLYDERGREFVWRQPRSVDEVLMLMTAADAELFTGYGWDGDDHWTPALVQQWWAERADRRPLVDALATKILGPRPEPEPDDDFFARFGHTMGDFSDEERATLAPIVTDYLAYLADGLEHDLRRYLFFLEQGHYPEEDDPLPRLT